MKRTMIGALWAMIFYLFGHAVVGLIIGSPAVDAWRPWIAFVAACVASAGSWQCWLPGTRNSKESRE